MESIFSHSNTEKLRIAALSDSSIPFPKRRLQSGTGKSDPIVFVACGSFSPVTYMHLRMFGEFEDLLFLPSYEAILYYRNCKRLCKTKPMEYHWWIFFSSF